MPLVPSSGPASKCTGRWALASARSPTSGLEFVREEKIPIYYKDRKIDTRRVDLVVEDCLVEIKAKSEFDPQDYVQTLSYLKASGYRVGLLVNFGTKKAEFRRLVNSASHQSL
jgi:GxxExxY protein